MKPTIKSIMITVILAIAIISCTKQPEDVLNIPHAPMAHTVDTTFQNR
jgi:hypothetical protein